MPGPSSNDGSAHPSVHSVRVTWRSCAGRRRTFGPALTYTPPAPYDDSPRQLHRADPGDLCRQWPYRSRGFLKLLACWRQRVVHVHRHLVDRACLTGRTPGRRSGCPVRPRGGTGPFGWRPNEPRGARRFGYVPVCRRTGRRHLSATPGARGPGPPQNCRGSAGGHLLQRIASHRAFAMSAVNGHFPDL